jgi:hypothetical protein
MILNVAHPKESIVPVQSNIIFSFFKLCVIRHLIKIFKKVILYMYLLSPPRYRREDPFHNVYDTPTEQWQTTEKPSIFHYHTPQEYTAKKVYSTKALHFLQSGSPPEIKLSIHQDSTVRNNLVRYVLSADYKLQIRLDQWSQPSSLIG